MIHTQRPIAFGTGPTASPSVRRYPPLVEVACFVVGTPILVAWTAGLAAAAGTGWVARRLLR